MSLLDSEMRTMKKILPISLLTLCFAALTQDQASAWINSRFGIGLNWSWQSGGNNFLWGLFRDGQPPCPGPVPGCAPPFLPGGPMPGGPMPGIGGPLGPIGGPGCGPGCGGGYSFPGAGFPVYGPADFQFFGRNNPPAGALPANLPQTAQNGNGSVYHPVSYSPAAAQQGYRYAPYAPQYPAAYPYRR